LRELKTEKSYFIKSIGLAPTASGSMRPKTFYLGHVDEGQRKAQARADRIRDAWEQLKASGHASWTPEALAALKLDEQRVTSPAVTFTPTGTRQTLRQVADMYCDMLDGRARKGQIGVGHATGERTKLNRAVDLAGPSLPMNQFDDAKLLATILTFCARPMTAHPHRKGAPRPMAIVSVREYLKTWRTFLAWAASTPMPGTTDKPLWVRPLRFDRHFSDNRPMMLDGDRRSALEAIEGKTEVKTYSRENLVLLHAAADTNAVKFGRLFLLLALNCGFANEEIADLKTYEVKLGDESYIHRFRGKTEKPGDVGVYAKWPLWKETADLLKEMIQTHDPEKPAILTPDGRRLIVGRADYVRSTWEIVQKRVPETERAESGLPRLSFKYLRKTSGTMIQNDLKYGDKIADAFLSHGNRGVIKVYTPRDWEQVAKAVAELRTHLEPMFVK
jgi:integrase